MSPRVPWARRSAIAWRETESALLLRWGRLPTVDPAHRYDGTDRAIAVLERQVAELEARPGPPSASLRRAQFDLLVAYRDRSRMRDAVAVYERLRQAGVTVPPYSRLSAASAYLYLEDPETARELYQSVVDEKPDDAEVRFEARLGLFYALVELERYDQAYEVIDAIDRDQPRFLRYLDTGASVENESKSTAAVAAALARFYGGQLAEAWDRLSPLAAAAPAASWLQADLAAVARARGWPRRSLALVEPWVRVEPNDVDIQLGRAASLLALRRYPEAGVAIEELYRVYPESKSVQDMKREWDVHRMWEWVTRVEPSLGAEPTTERAGADGRDAALVAARRGLLAVHRRHIASRPRISRRVARRGTGPPPASSTGDRRCERSPRSRTTRAPRTAWAGAWRSSGRRPTT